MSCEMDGGTVFALDENAARLNGLQTLKPKSNKENKLSHDDLLELLCILEAEVQAKDVIIKAMMHGRTGMAIPLSHLMTDADYADTSVSRCHTGDDEIWLGEPTAHLNHVIAYHQLVREQMDSLMASLQEQHRQIIQQLEEERYKHAADTAQGDDVTYMLEKERERLSNQLEFEIAKQKKIEKERDKLVQAINDERTEQNSMFESLVLDCEKYAKTALDHAIRENHLVKELQQERKRNKDLSKENQALTKEQEALKLKMTAAGKNNAELKKRLYDHQGVFVRFKEAAGLEVEPGKPDSKDESEDCIERYLDRKTVSTAKLVSLGKNKMSSPAEQTDGNDSYISSKISVATTSKPAKNRGTVSRTRPAIASKQQATADRKPLSITVGSKARVNGDSPSSKAKKTPPPAPPRVSSITRKSHPVPPEQSDAKASLIPKASTVMSSRIAKLRSNNSNKPASAGRPQAGSLVLPLAVVAGYGWEYSEEELAETNRLVDIISEIGIGESCTWQSLTEEIAEHLHEEGEIWQRDDDSIISGVIQYRIGDIEWVPSRLPIIAETPYNHVTQLRYASTIRPSMYVKLRDYNAGCVSALSFTSFTPASNLQEYIRLVQQYKSVLFVAKENVEARHFGTCLAQWLKSTQEMNGGACSVVKLDKDDLEEGRTATEYLIEIGILRSTSVREHTNESVILLLNADFLSTEYRFADGFDWLDKRGIDEKFHVVNGPSHARQSFYMPQNLTVMAYATQSCFETADQRIYRQFKVVNLPFITPLLIKRWLLQKAKINQLDEDVMWESYEWVAWTSDLYLRIKTSLEKLEIQSSSQVPLLFLSAPVHDVERMPSWARSLWFNHLCPIVEEGVRGSVTAAKSNQQQVLVSVTLQTLFERSFQPCCPYALDFHP